MGRGNPLFTRKEGFPFPHPTPSEKSGVFFAPVGRKKLIKLSPLNGNIAKNKNISATGGFAGRGPAAEPLACSAIALGDGESP